MLLKDGVELGEPLFDDVSEEDLEIAWQAILEILTRELTHDQISFLAAGAMEDLLSSHGDALIERVEVEASCNPRFNYLLGGCYRLMMTQDVWDRVQKVRLEVWQ